MTSAVFLCVRGLAGAEEGERTGGRNGRWECEGVSGAGTEQKDRQGVPDELAENGESAVHADAPGEKR